MKLSLLFRTVPLVAVLASLALCCSATAQTFPEQDSSLFENKYEGDVFNTSSGIPNYTPIGDIEFDRTDGQSLILDQFFNTRYYASDVWQQVADDAGGWTAEIRFQLDSALANDQPQLQWQVGDAENTPANSHETYRFFKTGILAIERDFTMGGGADLSSGFHTLRVAQPAGQNIFFMWLDGQPVDNISFGGFVGTNTMNTMWFGSGTTDIIDGFPRVDYLRFTGEGGFRCPGCAEPVVPNQWLSVPSGRLWDDPANWLTGTVPTDTAQFGGLFNTSGQRTVIVDNAVSAQRVEINNSFMMNFAGHGSVNLDGGGSNASIGVTAGSHQFQAMVNILSDTDVEIAADATLSFNDAVQLHGNTLTKTGAGTLNVNNRVIEDGGGIINSGGTLGGSGSIAGDLANAGGTVAPGNSSGVLTVDGNYSHDAGSKLAIELGGLTAGQQYDVLDVGGEIQLDGGTLELTLMSNFTPSVGDKFDILNFGSITGKFDTILLPQGRWDTGSLLVDGSVSLIPEPASLWLLVVFGGALPAFCRRQ